MNIKVSKDSVVITDTEYVINKGEYKVNKCHFTFSAEYTPDLVKKAIFIAGDIKKEMIIANNECNIPHEVLNSDEVELRVYAYESQNDELILRYSPTHTTFYLREGSYVEGASGSEEITPSQFEQYEQALQEGLAEVDGKLDDMDDALTEVDNLDVDANKVDTTTTITITKKDGTTKQVQVLDGRDGQDGAKGEPFTYEDFTPEQLEALTGPQGPAGLDGQDGQDGRDGYIQYTAGDNITIENNVISASGGGSGIVEISDMAGLTTLPKASCQKIIDALFENSKKNIYSVYILKNGNVAKYPEFYSAKLNKTFSTSTTSYNLCIGSIEIDYTSDYYLTYKVAQYSVAIAWENEKPVVSTVGSGTVKINYLYANGNTWAWTPNTNYSPANKKYVDDNANPKITSSSTATYTIASLIGNQVYKLGEITSLTISAITTFDKESIIYFDSGSTPTNISIPDTLVNLGDVPTLTSSGGVSTGTCEASKSYIIAILNNIAIWKAY